MSSAIIAKALNSTIGTDDFVGFDEILDSHLNKLDVILRQHAEDTKEALDAIYNISNPVFSTKSDDPVIAVLSASVQAGSSNYAYSKYLVLPYGGYLRYERDESDDRELTDFSIEGDGIIYVFGNTITFSKNAKIRFKARQYGDEEYDNYFNVFVRFRGHTEYAPEIKYTIE